MGSGTVALNWNGFAGSAALALPKIEVVDDVDVGIVAEEELFVPKPLNVLLVDPKLKLKPPFAAGTVAVVLDPKSGLVAVPPKGDAFGASFDPARLAPKGRGLKLSAVEFDDPPRNDFGASLVLPKDPKSGFGAAEAPNKLAPVVPRILFAVVSALVATPTAVDDDDT